MFSLALSPARHRPPEAKVVEVISPSNCVIIVKAFFVLYPVRLNLRHT